jgi:hypothetical protein
LHRDVCNNEEKKYGSRVREIWERKCSINISMKTDIYRKGKKDLVIMFDNENMPYWQEVFVP